MTDAQTLPGPGPLPAGLVDWIRGRRWFANTAAAPTLTVEGSWPLAAPAGVELAVLLVRDATPGAEALYQVPFAIRDGRIGDGTADPAFADALLALALGGGTATGDRVTATGAPALWLGPVPRATASRVLSGEQSNTSVIIDTDADRAVIVKLFRALHHGENPDVVLQSAIAAAGSTRVPATYGAVAGEWVTPDGEVRRGHLAVAQEFLAGTEDAWRVALAAARQGADFTAEAQALGGATAEVHRVLAQAFPAVPSDEAAKAAVGISMRNRAARALALVPELEGVAQGLGDVVDAGLAEEWPPLQRVHGDYHLGQVLAVPHRGWVLLDFEGEPLRPMAERSEPDLPLRDVAGMLRSFDYVAGTIELETGDAAAARAWADAARHAFLAGYETGIGEPLAAHTALLAALELDKALYECEYEVRNRPAWLPIPERAVRRLLAAVDA